MYEQEWLSNSREQPCYRTGFTQPKKTNQGVVAAVLMLAIFLGGMHTAFRLLDIRLFREITKDAGIASASVRFSSSDETQDTSQTPGIPALGITGESISSFEHLFYDIPTGVYITEISPGSPAGNAGILPGDVILYFDGQRTADLGALTEKMGTCSPGKSVCLLLYRKNAPYTVEIFFDNNP